MPGEDFTYRSKDGLTLAGTHYGAGNPGLRERRPEAIRAASAARQQVYVGDLIASASSWLPIVRRLRPQHSWDEVVRVLNHRGQSWTIEKLRRAVHRLVGEKMAEAELIQRSPRRPPEDRLMTLVAGIAIADLLKIEASEAKLSVVGDGTSNHGPIFVR